MVSAEFCVDYRGNLNEQILTLFGKEVNEKRLTKFCEVFSDF